MPLILHRNGRAAEAETLYRQVLLAHPDHAGALHLLGVIHHQRADHEEALRLIGRAIAVDPKKAVYWNNYGAALQSRGRYVEAMACFHRAVAMSCRMGFQPVPAAGEGTAASGDGLKTHPTYADALANLGMAQESLGQDEAALASLRQAIEIAPQHRDALNRLAALLQKLGRENEAIRVYAAAIRAQPTAELHAGLGNLLLAVGRADLAEREYRKAIALDPECAAAHFNLGSALQEQHRVEEVLPLFDRAAELRPQKPLWRLRAAATCPAVFRSSDEIEAYCERLSRALEAAALSEQNNTTETRRTQRKSPKAEDQEPKTKAPRPKTKSPPPTPHTPTPNPSTETS